MLTLIELKIVLDFNSQIHKSKILELLNKEEKKSNKLNKS